MKARVLIMTLLWTQSGLSAKVLAQNLYTPLEPWRGEFLQQSQGAFYIKIKLESFKKSARARNITTNVFLHLVDEKANRRYVVSQAVSEAGAEIPVWKLAAGDYTLQKISLNDNVGRTRQWISPGKPLWIVRRLFLSNAGLLTLSPFDKAGLRVRFQSQTNSFQNPYEHDSFAGVIDAYTSKLQVKLGGKEIFSEAKNDFSSGTEARAAFTHQRQIEMVYRVNIAKAQHMTPKVAQTVASQDLDLRRCYMDELDRDGSLRGNAAFRFQISKADGTMQKISYQGGSLKSMKVVQCLYFNMGKMQFPVAMNLQGDINFYFNYQDEPGRAMP